MSMIEKLRLRKPHMRKVKGVWVVYFSNAPGARNWEAYWYALARNDSEYVAHYYHPGTVEVGERGYL